MSYHKARLGKPVDPTQPTSTVLKNGRVAVPHAEIDGQPIMGGHNAIVEGVGRTPEEEKANIEEYHRKREETKKANAKLFDVKTGEPKVEDVKFESQPARDGNANTPAPVGEVKQNAETEKKKVEEKK